MEQKYKGEIISSWFKSKSGEVLGYAPKQFLLDNGVSEKDILEYEAQAIIGEKLAFINKQFEDDLKAITSKYPASERETWELQKTQAQDFISSKDEKKAPLIVVLAKANDITTLEFSKLVLKKATAYESLVATALAKKQKAINELEE